MPKFIINISKQPTGERVIHNFSNPCDHMPEEISQFSLGDHMSHYQAIYTAKMAWPNDRLIGCVHCCNPYTVSQTPSNENAFKVKNI